MPSKKSFAAIAFVLAAVVLGSPLACSGSKNGATFGTGDDDAGLTSDATDEFVSIVPDAGDSSFSDGGGVFNDAKIDVDAQSCVAGDAGGPGPVQRVCVHYGADDNECDGHHDLVGFPSNGSGGNGFDDDCDGLVDEGCSCDVIGSTKNCYLVPASQTVAGVPAGWCGQNSKGTVDCVKFSTEFGAHWSGMCRGAQPPFPDDICAPGDFDCDGKDQNSRAQDCTCKPGTVSCPTMPVQTVPYPDPNTLPLKIDAAAWFTSPSDVAQATNWKWTLSGGDCDNILPHPTFGMYPSSNGSGVPVGTQVDTLGTSGKEHGMVAQSPITSSVYPAFALSGDYLLQSDFDLYGQHHSCQIKVQVRAPGIRAEGCWDTEDTGAGHADLDLHVAKVNGFDTTCVNTTGWSDGCPDEDCYYGNCKYSGSGPQWYADSPATACVGWGSLATGPTCTNPRLDRDLIDCDRSVTNPNDSTSFGGYCGPENINIDLPVDGDKFAVAVKYYGGTPASRTHVNIYCNGVRVVSTGYNPVNGNDFPKLLQEGGDSTGDMWKVGMITAHVSGGMLTSCDVTTTQSQLPHVASDGSNAYCVDSTTTDGAQCTQLLTPSGQQPLDANAICFH
jgi:hypothetical protein